MEEVQKFDPSTLMQGVKDRIKATFVSLIPDDQWEVMVKKEIDAFFSGQEKYVRTIISTSHGYGNPTTTISEEGNISPFRAMVWDFCREETEKQLKEITITKYFGNSWNDEKIEEGMARLIEKVGPSLILKFFNGIAERSAMNLRNDIMNHRI